MKMTEKDFIWWLQGYLESRSVLTTPDILRILERIGSIEVLEKNTLGWITGSVVTSTHPVEFHYTSGEPTNLENTPKILLKD